MSILTVTAGVLIGVAWIGFLIWYVEVFTKLGCVGVK